MSKYEIMTIYNINLGEAKAKELSKEIHGYITSQKGTIESENFWGKRKFAYEIKHDTEGYYDVVNFSMDTSEIDALKTKLNLVEGLVRYLITAQD